MNTGKKETLTGRNVTDKNGFFNFLYIRVNP